MCCQQQNGDFIMVIKSEEEEEEDVCVWRERNLFLNWLIRFQRLDGDSENSCS